MNNCRICNNIIEPFISFGKMPRANGFLESKQFEEEFFFELKAAFCNECKMVQITEQPNRILMFNDNYPFFSCTSERMKVHFKNFADSIIKKYLTTQNSFVVEIGSNDGIMLQYFKDSGIRHLGIEPSSNVAQIAVDKGIQTIANFFDNKCAKEIVDQYGQADVILAANVMCHIPNIHSIIEGVKILLKEKGVLVFEDPYLGDVIEKTSYDQIYDEHVFLFSLTSLNNLFDRHDMEIFQVEPQTTHGGSMRYYVTRKKEKEISENILYFLNKEKGMKINRMDTFLKFRQNCEISRDKLKKILADIRKKGKHIAGYAATSKSTTILNYCQIDDHIIDYICDTTPVKQGKFSPGMHIPIKPYKDFINFFPDYAILFAYNHKEEIMAKEKKFVASGGKWIVYVPTIEIIS